MIEEKKGELFPKEKDGKLKKVFMKKHHWVILILLLVFLFVIVVGDIFLDKTYMGDEREITCGDSTSYGQCSLNSPYFCENGQLIEKATECGCPEVLEQNGDSCISQYQENAHQVQLNYIQEGQEFSINFTVYENLTNYLLDLPMSINYEENETPSRADFKIRNINEEEQRQLLLPLVIKIQNSVESKIDQLRMATSIVQHIDYGYTNKTTSFGNQEINYSRYAYDVVYEQEGICGEKTELLLFLLKELGYDVAFFYYVDENHESVGVKCSKEFSIGDSGYCFIETTGPSIISDDSIEYVGGVKLESSPEVYKISEGISLPLGLKEYKDAKLMTKLRKGEFVLFKDKKLENLQQRYGLIEEYNLE
jgi:hypothetical protein